MPCLRGIEVSLLTNLGRDQIPEYPHPEGSSVKLIGDGASRKHVSHSGINSTRGGFEAASPRYQPKAKPTVSVYVPSIPGKPSTPSSLPFNFLARERSRGT